MKWHKIGSACHATCPVSSHARDDVSSGNSAARSAWTTTCGADEVVRTGRADEIRNNVREHTVSPPRLKTYSAGTDVIARGLKRRSSMA
eukprot:30294-Pelagococcus_subviridis.AAC.31